jgi:hypothetical protein
VGTSSRKITGSNPEPGNTTWKRNWQNKLSEVGSKADKGIMSPQTDKVVGLFEKISSSSP